jgi:hypothetical protein
MNIIEKIKSFEDACAVLSIEPNLPVVSGLVEKHKKSIIAFYKLCIIIQALNEGWEPDWKNLNQNKYYNYFLVGGSAFYGANAGFVGSYSADSPATTTAAFGSRLCFKSKKLAEYVRINFIELYKDYLLST